jgi:hypothetical protein
MTVTLIKPLEVKCAEYGDLSRMHSPCNPISPSHTNPIVDTNTEVVLLLSPSNLIYLLTLNREIMLLPILKIRKKSSSRDSKIPISTLQNVALNMDANHQDIQPVHTIQTVIVFHAFPPGNGEHTYRRRRR